MKNIRFFSDAQQYYDFVFNEVFKTDITRKHPFYRNLIQWVLMNRTPLFFEASDKSEYAHFTQYFGMMLMREYESPIINDLYYLHDFVHALFEYPIYPRSMPFEKFARIAIDNEYVASNETEILVYRRVRNLRERTFPKTILYDLLDKVWFDQWNPVSLLDLRQKLASSDTYWALFNREGNPAREIQKFMSRVSANWVWCALWYDNVPRMFAKPFWNTQGLYLSHALYPQVIENYNFSMTAFEENYRGNIENLARTWIALTFGTETHFRFEQVPALLERMEGKIILPKAAKIFSQMYEKMKEG